MHERKPSQRDGEGGRDSVTLIKPLDTAGLNSFYFLLWEPVHLLDFLPVKGQCGFECQGEWHKQKEAENQRSRSEGADAAGKVAVEEVELDLAGLGKMKGYSGKRGEKGQRSVWKEKALPSLKCKQ